MKNVIIDNEKIELDEGIFFGKGVFETIYIYNGKAILLEEHIKRLNKGIENLEIGGKIDLIELEPYIKSYSKENNMAIKILVTPKNIIINSRKSPYSYENYKDGFKVKLSNVIRNSTSVLTYIKSICYIENLLENRKAKEEGYNEVIFLNENGYITEGSTSNIFIIKDGNIITPTIESGLLSGIIRGWVIDNFKVLEKKITLVELIECDEIFITNSLVGIMKVSSFMDKEFTNCKITKEIIEKYVKYIKKVGGKKNDR